MEKSKPAPTPVSEETGRQAVARAVAGVAEQQRIAGRLPDTRAAEAFVRPIVEQTIKKHEERAVRDWLTPKSYARDDSAQVKPGESKARLDRGDVGENTTVISRPIDWKRKQAQKRPKNSEDRKLLERMELLEIFPEWRNRLLKAAADGEMAAINSGSPQDRQDMKRRMSIVADHMLKVVEQSNNVFGDYLNPRALPSGPIFSFGVKKP